MEPEHLTKRDFEELARFRSNIRRYLRFSEEAVRRRGLTPQHYQLMLALKGFPGREWATMRELADQLQLRHHSVVELVDRAHRHNLVERVPDPTDARAVRVQLTADGHQALAGLSELHRDELRRLGTALAVPIWDLASEDSSTEPSCAGGNSADAAQAGRRQTAGSDHPDSRDAL